MSKSGGHFQGRNICSEIWVTLLQKVHLNIEGKGQDGQAD